MKKFLHYFGILLSFFGFLFFLNYFSKNLSNLPPIDIGPLTYLCIFLGLFLTSLPVIFGGIAWFLLLRDTKDPAPMKDSILIFTISQFGKYLPGNFGHHLGRISLSLAFGLNISSVVFTMVIEIYLSILSCFILSAITFLNSPNLYFLNLSTKLLDGFKFITIIFACFIILIFALSFCKRIKTFYFNLFSKHSFSINKISTLLKNICLYTLGFFCIGITMHILSVGIFKSSQGNILLLTGIFSIAWLAGFITPGAPAGIGVRESILIIALEPLFGSGIALGITALLRILTTSSDILSFIIALAIKKLTPINNFLS